MGEDAGGRVKQLALSFILILAACEQGEVHYVTPTPVMSVTAASNCNGACH